MVYNRHKKTMKKSILTLAFLSMSAISFSQLQLATLEHNDSIVVFYGSSAFQQAHDAAERGDIITLSPGGFSSFEITKPLTIRGAGMFADSLKGTLPTIVVSSPQAFKINVPDDSVYYLSIEGIRFNTYISLYNIRGMRMNKCIVQDGLTGYMSGRQRCVDGVFTNCLISHWGNMGGDSVFHNNLFVNCVLLGMNDSYNTFNHCVVNIIGSKFTANNSVLFHKSSSYTSLSSANANNCIGIYTYGNYNYFDSEWRPYNMNIGGGDDSSKFARVFKTFDGNTNSFVFSETESFEITDSIASLYPASDGTQVGVYGGMMPFNSHMGNRRVTVASQTTPDGKLEVDIEAINE